MKEPLILDSTFDPLLEKNNTYWIVTGAILLGSLALVALSNKETRDRKKRKVKDRIWQGIFKDIEDKLVEVTPSNELVDVVLSELKIAISEYIEDYRSQTKYFTPYINQLEKVENERYTIKMREIRKVLNSLQENIS